MAMASGGGDRAGGATSAGTWNNQDPQLLPGTEDDFQQFLDMNSMDGLAQFDFSTDFQGANGGSAMMDATAPRDPQMDTPMTGIDMQNPAAIPITAPTSMPTVSPQMIPPVSTDHIMNIDAQIQMLQNQKLQAQQQQRQRQQPPQQQQQQRLEEQQAMIFSQPNRLVVPPTPQSAELHGSTGQVFGSDPTASHMYDRFQRLREQQDMSFTPLVSPAVTPLETQFPIENHFLPNPYFSPLSSPALHAQNDGMSYDRLAGLSVNSPVDMPMEQTLNQQPPPPDLHKARKASAVSKSRSKANVRQSHITKAQKKRTASTPNIAKHVLNEIAEASAAVESSSDLLPAPAQSAISTDTSEGGSASPEAVTDMPPPPPPQPRSARQSPLIAAKKKGPISQARNEFPAATPASLMRLPSPEVQSSTTVANGSTVVVSENIDNLELPESVTSNTEPAKDVRTRKQGSATPKMTTQPPAPSPVFAKPSGTVSATQSPYILPGPATSGGPTRKTPQFAARNSKKRSSASVQSSPALRPRISPSMKPLLPGTSGMSMEDTASRLLATKSNYQNILEGNTVPGVSYPSELSTNLTSKRTSHKIAEQGRRNRINSALQEIATLLPKGDVPVEVQEKEKKDKQGNLPNSKASTVEQAIQYIKELQQQVESEKERADSAEQKLQMLGG